MVSFIIAIFLVFRSIAVIQAKCATKFNSKCRNESIIRNETYEHGINTAL